MVLVYDPNMATSASTQRTINPSLRFPIRTLDSRSSIRTRRNASRLEWRHSPSLSPLAADSSLRSPTTSCCSHDSFAGSDSTMSSNASSPPRSPLKQEQMKQEQMKQEQMDTSLYSLPRQPLPQPDTKSGTFLPPITNQESTLPPITRRESADGPLPGLRSIFQAPITPPSANQVQNMSDRLSAFKLNVSLDLSSRNDHVSSHQPRADPIASHLFQQRWERQNYRQDETVERYSEQAGYTYRRPSPPSLLRTANLGHRYRPYDIAQRYDRNDTGKKLRRNDIPHNNTRYTQEEMDFIRYHKVDLAKPWGEVELVFGHAFPVDASKQRHQQGVQGVFYREHKTMPMLDPTTNSFVYLPNGHVKAIQMKCREQKAAEAMFREMTETGKIFGLLNLFPEAALTYSWVRDEDKLRIASLAIRRRQEREAAQSLAKNNGLESTEIKNEMCACCVNLKRDKRSRKSISQKLP